MTARQWRWCQHERPDHVSQAPTPIGSDTAPTTGGRPRLRLPRGWPSVATLIQLVLLVLIVLCPMFFIVMGAFTDNADRADLFDFGSFTLDNLGVLGTQSARHALVSSAIVGIGSSIVALGIGCTLAFLAARTDAPGRKMIYGIGIAPLFLPSLVGALAWAR